MRSFFAAALAAGGASAGEPGPRQAATTPYYAAFIWVSDGGDEGGIVCKLDFDREGANAVFASITPLSFDPKAAPARAIAAHQKHLSRISGAYVTISLLQGYSTLSRSESR